MPTFASRALRRSFAFAASSFLALSASHAGAAPAAPSGAHPRIWLDAKTLAAMKTNSTKSGTWAAKLISDCAEVGTRPSQYKDGQYYGYAWGYAAASCGVAWQLTQNPTYAANGLAMWTALLNDLNTVGDGLGGDKSVQGDDGYGMRYFAAYTAVAYDWLHDAPNAAALVTQSQERFKAWIGWCDTSCYLKSTPGSNYHAGYVFAKALIAVAASGEDDGSAAGYWAAAVDTQYGHDIVANGLADGGCLVGGDWPEGWEYGTLGVLEYSLGARALEENGAPFPAIDAWAGALALKYIYSTTPDQTGMYIGGDWGSQGTYAGLAAEPLDAVLAGGSSDDAAGWAQYVKANVAKGGALGLINDALGEARGATAVQFSTTTPPLLYVAPGTRNVFARSSWDKTGFWSVFTSAPRLGPDHQHLDSSNVVFTRGADDLIVDPSPYGSLSTLTSNAITVDSQTVEEGYRPSQSGSSLADLPWARGTQDGTAAARADLDLAFIADRSSKKTDVPYARREWTFLPEGEVVTIDRVRASTATQKTYLRFRSLASNLTLSAAAPWTATGTVGGSQVVIHATVLPAGTPVVKAIPSTGTNGCGGGGVGGGCTDARFAVDEYSVQIPSSPSLAIHVIDGLGTGEAPATALSITDPSVDTTPAQNGGVIGVSVTRSATRSYVVASSAVDGKSGATLTYGVPGDTAARHVVFDAPEDANGISTVAASAASGRCVISITAGGSSGFAGHPLIFDVATAASGCTASESKSPPPATAGSGDGASSGGASSGGASSGGGGSGGGGANGSSGSSGGCGCNVVGGGASSAAWAGTIAGMALFFARRRRQRSLRNDRSR